MSGIRLHASCKLCNKIFLIDLVGRSTTPTESYESIVAEMTQLVLRSHLSTSSGCQATADDMIVIKHEKLISIDMSVGDAIQLHNVLHTVCRRNREEFDDDEINFISRIKDKLSKVVDSHDLQKMAEELRKYKEN